MSQPLQDRRPLDGKRVSARLLDGLIVGLPVVGYLVWAGAGADAWAIALAIQLSYFFVAEAVWGQTLGKRVAGLKVMRPDGTPAAPGAIAARTILRVVEDNLIGLLVMVVSGRRRRRLGDLLGGTIVARVEDCPERPPRSWQLAAYPAAWLVLAVGYGLLPSNEAYLAKMDAICKARTDITDRYRLPPGEMLALSVKETDRMVRLDPPPGMRGLHRQVIASKRRYERLGREAIDTTMASSNPQLTWAQTHEPMNEEARRHNEIFDELGLEHCAR